MALDKLKTYYTPDEDLPQPDENQRFTQEWSDPRVLAALGEGEGGLSALKETAEAFEKRKMVVPYTLRKALQDKTSIDPRATMEGIESGKLAPADNLPPFTPYPVSKNVTFFRALEQAVNKQGLVGDLKPPVEMPKTVPSLTMPSGIPAKPALNLPMAVNGAAPIPTASSGGTKSIAPTGSANPALPAGTPDSMGRGGMVAPPSDGAGGDTSERDLYLARLAAQNAAGFGGMGAGKNIDMGIADTLGERLKQVQALRAKREDQGITDTRERANNRAQVDYLISRFPDRADDLQKLYGMTGKPNFSQMLRVEEQVALDRAKKTTEEVRPDIARRGIEVKEEDAESKAKKRDEDIALGWARVNAQVAAATAAAARDIASSGASRAEQKDIDNHLENIQKIVKGGGYTPLIASLEQADKAIATLGAPPSATAQMKHGLPGGDRLLSPQEKAYFNSVDKLKQMEALAISGKVVSVQERAEFIRQYGTSWYASPEAAAAYINMLRAKTANQLNSDLASVRASPSGQKAIAAYERQPGAVTPMNPVFKGAGAVSTATGPTESQIAKLRANSDKAAEFDKKFGPGAAAKILGGP